MAIIGHVPNHPTISIIMPTFNRAHQIGESIASLINQTFRDFELIVNDDCSLESPETTVRQFGDERVKYFRNLTSEKMPGNLNSGIMKAKGRYILVCHDHDVYHNTLIEKMLEMLENSPTVLWVHAGVAGIDQNSRDTGFRSVQDYQSVTPGNTWSRVLLSRLDCPVCANAMVRREAYDRYGLYDTKYGFISDVEMWMRLSRHGDVGYIKEPLIWLRQREQNHEYSGVSWLLIEKLIAIHIQYTQQIYGGASKSWNLLKLKFRVDRYLLRLYTYSVIHGDAVRCAEGKQFIRRLGLPLSTLATYGM